MRRKKCSGSTSSPAGCAFFAISVSRFASDARSCSTQPRHESPADDTRSDNATRKSPACISTAISGRRFFFSSVGDRFAAISVAFLLMPRP